MPRGVRFPARETAAHVFAESLRRPSVISREHAPVEAYLDAASTGPERRRLSASAERWRAAAAKAAQR